MSLFDGGAKDRAQLQTALRSLGPTTVDRLSDALHWPPPRTVRTLRALTDGTRFDPTTGGILPPLPAGSPAPPPPAPSAPAPGPAPALLLGPCPECGEKLSPTGRPGMYYCAECGFLEERHAPTAAPPPSAAPPSGAPGMLDPRQAQELIAAWVTSQPILCPQCRQPLHHQGVEAYSCPACGETVRFTDHGVAAVPRAPVAGT